MRQRHKWLFEDCVCFCMDAPAENRRIDYENGFYLGPVGADGETEEGYGMFVWKTGEVYVGDFRHGVRTGHGTFTWSDGAEYEGDFLDGNRSGRGRLRWPSGDAYEGDFAGGVRTGQGIMRWASGEHYEGNFRDGQMDGDGTLFDADGTVRYAGHWVSGLPVHE